MEDIYKECGDCVHRNSTTPCPCDSCEQLNPTNFTEEE